ncbi:MurR/RpiR family transcriptional regulator [Fundicoccus culcitae]|uniref:MurR/RpiR family transcriptional regulator n=1 Tax=Fundicoccus culcitae TaxID=2969821 RepID=A0ABY5P3E5_9LACT|nr:MurR/RpiR family transcriptional regulator [Fundicoccus culcitae]UUX33249.1 MurR/RpiR family transcriptional regulator [Fundicoccus culcitae]
MLLDNLENKKDFTTSEQLIADYILKNPTAVQSMTAEELGKKSFTSKATVLRFCNKLDLKGFNDLRHHLIKEIYEKNRLIELIEDEPIHDQSTLEEIITVLPSLYDRAIGESKLRWDDKALKQAIKLLKEAEFIDIYGSGITYSCATAAAFKFQSIGLNADAHHGLNEHAIKYRKGKRNSVAILLSFTGGNVTMSEVGQYLKDNGIMLIGVGGLNSPRLQSICHQYIAVEDRDYIFNIESIGSYISITYVMDILYLSLLSEDYQKNLEAALEVHKERHG